MTFVQFQKLLSTINLAKADAEGNIRAQVGLRQDSLDQLILVNNAIEGEIALASDYNAAVTYTGDPITSTVISFGYSHSLSIGLTGSYPAGNTNVLNIDGSPNPISSENSADIVDTVADLLLIPTYTNLKLSDAKIYITLGAPPADATYVSLELQSDMGSGNYFPVNFGAGGGIKYTIMPDAFRKNSTFAGLIFNLSPTPTQLNAINSLSTPAMRLVLSHDGSTDYVFQTGKNVLDVQYTLGAA